MFTKFVTIISIVSVGAGEFASNMQQYSHNHGEPSNSFHRDQLFSYGANHVYTTQKSIPFEHKTLNNQYHQPEKEIHFRSIQYAPLVNPEDLKLQNAIPTKVTLHSPHNIIMSEYSSELPKRNHLEPRLGATEKSVPRPIAHLDFIPGHNIEVLQTVNRSPGHNAVYRSYPGSNSNDLNKRNYLLQYMIYQNTQRQTEASYSPSTDSPFFVLTTTTAPKTLVAPMNIKSSQFFRPKLNPYKYEVPRVLQNMQPKAPYTKMHALLLNVARAYNFAVLPKKANMPRRSDHMVLDNSPAYIRSAQLQAQPPEKKTILFPVQKKLHFALHS